MAEDSRDKVTPEASTLPPLESILETVSDSLQVFDREWRYAYMNARAEALLGRPRAELLGRVCWEVYPEAVGTPFYHNYRRAMETGAPLVFEDYCPHQNTWVEFSLRPFPQGLAAYARDITERKRSEIALAESEARFRSMADSAPVLIWMSGTDGRCYYLNRRWLEFTGRTLEQEAGDGWTEGVHPDDLPRFLDTYRSHFEARKPFEMEYRLRRHDGEYRWILDIGIPLMIGDRAKSFAGYIGSCIDTTERVASRQFLRDVLASVTEGRLRLCSEAGDLPAPLAPVTGAESPVTLTDLSLRHLRRYAQCATAQEDFPSDRTQDLLTAVGEAAMNAVRHAGGGEGRVYAGGGRVQVWVADTGGGIDVDRLPQATLERGYSSAGTFGHGFWLMLKTCDRVHLLTGPTGTTVVLEQGRESPIPAWFAD